jgi:PPIC-type PPIASE domain
MKRLLKEPLLHFLVLGTLLFAVYSRLNRSLPDNKSTGGTVRITSNEIAWLKETWSRQWQREPTRDELRGLVTDFLKEELLAREARALGLDQNDTIVRRRLAQKLEFLVQDTSRFAEPTEEDLRRFYDANPERFQTDARISFTHVFFSREKRAAAATEAKAALTDLAGGANPADFGDRLLVDSEIVDADMQSVAGQFGRDFADAVFALKPGGWSGPIESGYGLHLVRVSEVKRANRREFSEVKTQVLERWREQRQREDNEKYFASLLKKYDVVVDDSVKPLIGPLDEPMSPPINASGE